MLLVHFQLPVIHVLWFMESLLCSLPGWPWARLSAWALESDSFEIQILAPPQTCHQDFGHLSSWFELVSLAVKRGRDLPGEALPWYPLHRLSWWRLINTVLFIFVLLSFPFTDGEREAGVNDFLKHTGRSLDKGSWILVFSLGHNPPRRPKNSNLFSPELNR